MSISLCCLLFVLGNEIVVANRKGQPKLVLMSRELYENGLGKVMENPLINVRRDMELVAEPVLIRTFNNPAHEPY